jgi:hypothetical protein
VMEKRTLIGFVLVMEKGTLMGFVLVMKKGTLMGIMLGTRTENRWVNPKEPQQGFV